MVFAADVHFFLFGILFTCSLSVSTSLRFVLIDELFIEDLQELLVNSLAPAPTALRRSRSDFVFDRVFLDVDLGIDSGRLHESSS